MQELIKQRITESIAVKQAMIQSQAIMEVVSETAVSIAETIKKGGKLVLCGNGGSASDALHFAGEIVGRFQQERSAWPAVVLNADVATMTAIANDYGYGNVFARQAQGFVNSGDLFIGISTSGNSENIFRAVEVAKVKGAKTVALLGKGGGKIGKVVDYPIIVPCDTTARIQESHITLIHIMCEIVEELLNE